MSNPLQNTHWFDIPGVSSKQETLDNPFLIFTRKLTGFETTPVIIHMGNGYLHELDNFNHSASDIKKLNQQGLKIFLYEPICARTGQHHNRQFFSEFNFDEDPNSIRADELDSIKNYIVKHNLTNVTVHTCDYNAEVYFPYYSPYMKLCCDDLFIKNYSVFETTTDKKVQKKFISVNWRHSKHRHLIVSVLSKASSYYSWYFKSSLDTLNEGLWFDLKTWKNTQPDVYRQVLEGLYKSNADCPSLIDLESAEPILVNSGYSVFYPKSVKYFGHNNPAFDNPKNKILESFYNQVFCDVVNETRFAQHTGNFSEKLFQPVRYKTPFILVAPPYTLEYAKNYGFKTFDNFWDESYDRCENHEQRLLKIIKLINYINSLSLEQCQSLYYSMTDILEHNYSILVEKSPFKTIQK